MNQTCNESTEQQTLTQSLSPACALARWPANDGMNDDDGKATIKRTTQKADDQNDQASQK